MRKALIQIVLLIIVLLLCFSCKQAGDPYEAYPFDGKVYSDPEVDASVSEGTYSVRDTLFTSFFGYGNSYYVTLKNDGSLVITPETGYLFPLDEACTTGTWSLNGSTMTIAVFEKSFSGTKKDSDTGFEIVKSSYEGIVFKKITNDQIDITAFSSRKLNGLYMRADSYGANYGYRFLSDGTAWYYSTDKKSTKLTYKISTKGTKITINNSEFDNNFSDTGKYLFIGSAVYMKVD